MINNNLITVGLFALSTVLVSAAPVPFPAPHPHPQPKASLGNLLGGGRFSNNHNHRHGQSSKSKGLLKLPVLGGGRSGRILEKKNLLDPVEDILGTGGSGLGSGLGDGPGLGSGSGSSSGLGLGLVENVLEPITGPVTDPITTSLGAVLGVDIDLLTPTDLLCAKVDGIFLEQAYALGCVCLGQDGLLLTAEAGAHVVDGLVDWVKAKVSPDRNLKSWSSKAERCRLTSMASPPTTPSTVFQHANSVPRMTEGSSGAH